MKGTTKQSLEAGRVGMAKNREIAIIALWQAQDALWQAHLALINAQEQIETSGNYYLQGDIAHYAHEVRKLLTSDGGECGITALVAKLQADQKAGKF